MIFSAMTSPSLSKHIYILTAVQMELPTNFVFGMV